MDWDHFFAGMPDFWLEWGKKHQLVDILVIALCALLSGADDFEEIEAYGRQKEPFLRTFLALPKGIPSHDTFTRVFRHMDTEAFGRCLYGWPAQVLAGAPDALQPVNIDGKVLRGTARAGAKKSDICVVSAWAAAHGLVLGQAQVATKSNEKTAIPELLAALDLQGALISGDAAGCQRATAARIVAGGGHYLLALKRDQATAYERVQAYLSPRLAQMPVAEHYAFGSGRVKQRTCWVDTRLDLLDALADWPGLHSVIRVEASREVHGQRVQQTHYYLSSLRATVAEFNRYIRQHWHIENRLHWRLDVVFREDQQRVRCQNGPLNMVTTRKIVLQALGRMDDKHSLKNRSKMAGWDDDYLRAVLTQMNAD